MIVFCEECGERNLIDPAKSNGKPRCLSCNDILRLPISQTTESLNDVVQEKAISRLELTFQEDVIEISKVRPSITMGRQRYNDLVVEDNRVSRSHARFEYRRNEFVLIDQSTNGTYVFVKGKKGMNLRQDELPLNGSGFIGLGRKVASNSPEAIHFTIKRA